VELSKIKFDGKDFVKAVGFIGFVGSMWFDLKSEQIKAHEKIEFLQYQINQINNKKDKQLVAILPKELKLEDKEN